MMERLYGRARTEEVAPEMRAALRQTSDWPAMEPFVKESEEDPHPGPRRRSWAGPVRVRGSDPSTPELVRPSLSRFLSLVGMRMRPLGLPDNQNWVAIKWSSSRAKSAAYNGPLLPCGSWLSYESFFGEGAAVSRVSMCFRGKPQPGPPLVQQRTENGPMVVLTRGRRAWRQVTSRPIGGRAARSATNDRKRGGVFWKLCRSRRA